MYSPAVGRITSEYGHRTHPVTGANGNLHKGIDIANSIGAPIYAVFAGTVRATRTDSYRGDKRPNKVTGTWNTGNFVLIDGPGGGSEWYGHLHKVHVKAGDKVKAGQQIGTMGDTGNVTGSHLHFETWGGRSTNDAYNPCTLFSRHGVTPGKAGKGKTVTAPVRAVKAASKHLTTQKRLKNLGYYKGRLDGKNGSHQKAAVNAYIKAQRYKPGLIADGDWGAATEAHYLWVKTLQKTLNAWKGNDVPVDGDYGSNTKSRVSYTQGRNGLKRDGIAGPATCKLLKIRTHPGL